MFRFNSAQTTITFQFKRVAALVGSAALLASGLVAGVAIPANAAPSDASKIRVTRSFTNDSVVIRPGEQVGVNVWIQTKNAYKLNENSFAAGDSITIEPNEISAGLTRTYARWEGAFAKYSSGYYERRINSTNLASPLLTFSMNSDDVTNAAEIFYWSYQTSFVNNTQNDITYSLAAPTVKTSKSVTESVLDASNYTIETGGGLTGSVSININSST